MTLEFNPGKITYELNGKTETVEYPHVRVGPNGVVAQTVEYTQDGEPVVETALEIGSAVPYVVERDV